MKKVAVYLRCASNDHREVEVSCNQQLMIIEKLLGAWGVNEFDVYQDIGNDFLVFRKSYQMMIEGVKSRKYDVIVTKDVSRISRDFNQFREFQAVLDEHDVSYISAERSTLQLLAEFKALQCNI